jgi:hypothetical protein
LRSLRARLKRLIFERGQIDTNPRVQLSTLGLDAPGRFEYAPSGWLLVHRALRGVRITPDDVFIDFGSGMGRAVYVAARWYPFGRVVGVEISEELNATARANIARTARKLRCKDVELITCDATQYAIPDDMTYAYFYNPFIDDLFETVLENICASLDRRPRKLRLCYANPVMTDAVIESGRFVHLRTSSGWRRNIGPHRLSLFESRT